MDNDQQATASEARRNALAFSLGFGELTGSATLVEWVDILLEGYSLVNITAVNIPDSVKFGKTKDPAENALADYKLYRKTHFSERKCAPECPYCARARQARVVKEGDEYLKRNWSPNPRGGFKGLPSDHASLVMKASSAAVKRKELRPLTDHAKKQLSEIKRLQGVWKEMNDEFFSRYRAGEDMFGRRGYQGIHMAAKHGGTKNISSGPLSEDKTGKVIRSLDWNSLDVESDEVLSNLISSLYGQSALLALFNEEIASLGQALG